MVYQIIIIVKHLLMVVHSRTVRLPEGQSEDVWQDTDANGHRWTVLTLP